MRSLERLNTESPPFDCMGARRHVLGCWKVENGNPTSKRFLPRCGSPGKHRARKQKRGHHVITTSVVTVAQNPTALNITVPRTSATSGKEMYEAYCAACHGKGGKGDGPVASALKTPPPNLTDLSRRNNGEYPWLLVVNTISGPVGTSAHGSREMPIWGPVFTSMSHQHESEVRQRIANLTDYVKSLQQK